MERLGIFNITPVRKETKGEEKGEKKRKIKTKTLVIIQFLQNRGGGKLIFIPIYIPICRIEFPFEYNNNVLHYVLQYTLLFAKMSLQFC